MLNSVVIMGRLTSDPSMKSTPNGTPVASFRIAVDRTFQPKGQEKQTDFIDIVAWRNTAEFIGKYFRKGSMIVIQGSLQTRQYTMKDGSKRTAVEVIANEVFFGESKRDNEQPAQSYSKKADVELPSDFEEITGDDELPF